MPNTHNYPKGAITSETDLLFHLLGQPLYNVHGLGESSYLTELINVRNLHTHKYGSRIFEYDEINLGYSATCHLADFNIGSHHNHHYLFRNREDADAYLEYARYNTNGIRPVHYQISRLTM